MTIKTLKIAITAFTLTFVSVGFAFETPDSIVQSLRKNPAIKKIWSDQYSDMGVIPLTQENDGMNGSQTFFRRAVATVHDKYVYNNLIDFQLFLTPLPVVRGEMPNGGEIVVVLASDRDGSLPPKLAQAEAIFAKANQIAKLKILTNVEQARTFTRFTIGVKDSRGLETLLIELGSILDQIRAKGFQAVIDKK